VSFQEYNHNYKEFTTYNLVKNVLKNDSPKADLVSKGAIVVENDVWIGTQCVILGGAYISTGAVVSANSVVNSFVTPYAIVAGSPARIVKYRFDKNTIDALLETKWWDWDKVDIIKNVETLRNIVK
jgi:acetyltransferase-like isoleucine patch superfamily enzyme